MKKIKIPADSKGYCTVSSLEYKVHPALKEYFGYCLKKAAERHTILLNEELSKSQLVAGQFGILVVLRASDPLNQNSIGEEMGIDKATIVKLIDGLESLGFVERLPHKEDRRIKLVRITPKGERFASEQLKRATQITEKFLSCLTSNERQILHSALSKLIESPIA